MRPQVRVQTKGVFSLVCLLLSESVDELVNLLRFPLSMVSHRNAAVVTLVQVGP